MAHRYDSRLTRANQAALGGGLTERDALEARVEIGALIRSRLRHAGLDPAAAPALLLCEAAAARLASSVGAGKPHAPDEAMASATGGGKGDDFVSRITAIVERRPQGELLDLAAASLAELFAWCLTAPDIPDPPDPPPTASG